MIDLVLKWWAAGLQILGTLPPWFAAFLVGWAASIGVTHAVKFSIPLAWIEVDFRELTARLVAFFAAFLGSGYYYASTPDSTPVALILVMVLTGLWSPIVYALLIAFLRRGGRESFVADVLSGDKRGVLAAKLRGSP